MKVIIYVFIIYILYQSIFKKNIEPATWNPGVCSDGINTTQTDCESAGETWSHPVCDTIDFISTQAQCESLTEDSVKSQSDEREPCPQCNERESCPEREPCPRCPRCPQCPKSNSSSHFVEYRFIYSIITLLLSIYSIYLSFVINNGFDFPHFLMACCCWPCYLPYALFKKSA